jgi:hypothetical protein
MIFYAFSKFQHFGNTIEDSVFRLGPWKFKIPYRKALGLRIAPQEDLIPRNVVLGHRPAAVRWNSSEGRRAAVGKGTENGVGLPTARFLAGVGAEERPAAVFADARRRQPQGARLWRALGRGGKRGGTHGSTGP